LEASPDEKFATPCIEKTHHKKGVVEWFKQGVGPEFKPQYQKTTTKTCMELSTEVGTIENKNLMLCLIQINLLM
jgi:hypothetical protein